MRITSYPMLECYYAILTCKNYYRLLHQGDFDYATRQELRTRLDQSTWRIAIVVPETKLRHVAIPSSATQMLSERCICRVVMYVGHLPEVTWRELSTGQI